MKKTVLLAVLLGGCAYGINHNVATINGKQYLIETKNYASPILPVYQWSEESTFKQIDGNIDQKIVNKQIEEIIKSCKRKASKQTSQRAYDYEKFFDCVTDIKE